MVQQALGPQQQQPGGFQAGGFQQFAGGAPTPGPRIPQAPPIQMPQPPQAPQLGQAQPWSPSPLRPSVSTSESFRPMLGTPQPQIHAQMHPQMQPMAHGGSPFSGAPQPPSQLSLDDIINMLSSGGMPNPQPLDVPALQAQQLPSMGAAPQGAQGMGPQSPHHNRLSALMRAILPGV